MASFKLSDALPSDADRLARYVDFPTALKQPLSQEAGRALEGPVDDICGEC